MPQAFQMDLKQIAKFARLSAKAPRRFAAATGMILNSMAFGTRTEAINVISETMTIKQPGFVPRRLQVEKSGFSLPVTSQVSRVGSVPLARFSGWTEQQTGEPTERSRVFTLMARQGTKARPAVRAARLLPGGDRPDADDFNIEGAKDEDHRQEIFLHMMRRRKRRRPFVIRKHSKFAPGLYRFKGRGKRPKLQLLQAFKPRKVQPRRIPWLTMAEERYLKSTRARRDIKAALDRVFRFLL